MGKEIVVTYDGIDIKYEEGTNRWLFELRGRERSAESLTNAKAAIDKPEPKAKKNIDPIPAIKREPYGVAKYEKCKITSIAEGNRWRESAWVTTAKGNREKVDVSDLFADGAKNEEILAAIKANNKTVDELHDENSKLAEKLIKVDLSPFKETAEG